MSNYNMLRAIAVKNLDKDDKWDYIVAILFTDGSKCNGSKKLTRRWNIFSSLNGDLVFKLNDILDLLILAKNEVIKNGRKYFNDTLNEPRVDCYLKNYSKITNVRIKNKTTSWKTFENMIINAIKNAINLEELKLRDNVIYDTFVECFRTGLEYDFNLKIDEVEVDKIF